MVLITFLLHPPWIFFYWYMWNVDGNCACWASHGLPGSYCFCVWWVSVSLHQWWAKDIQHTITTPREVCLFWPKRKKCRWIVRKSKPLKTQAQINAGKEHANQTAFDFPIVALSTFHVDVTGSAALYEIHLGPVYHGWDMWAALVPWRWKQPTHTHLHIALHVWGTEVVSSKSIWYEISKENNRMISNSLVRSFPLAVLDHLQ